MSLIRAKLVGDVVSGSTFAGIVTATGFVGNLTGDVTGNVTGNLAGVAATSGFANQAAFASFATNAGIASTAFAASVAYSMVAGPETDMTVGVITATAFSGNGADLSNLNADNLTSGRVATARLASGTANSSSYLRGDQTWAAVPSGGFSNMQVFTTPGTFTVPATTTKLKVTATGAGGPSIFSGGGCSGATGIAVFNVSPNAVIPVTVGGVSAPSFISPGTGGSSGFGGFVVAGGGSGSVGGSAAFPFGAGAYQATLALNGGSGNATTIPITGTTPGSASGAASYWGSAGLQSLSFFPSPVSQGSFGAGGGIGAGNQGYSPMPGVVVVEW